MKRASAAEGPPGRPSTCDPKWSRRATASSRTTTPLCLHTGDCPAAQTSTKGVGGTPGPLRCVAFGGVLKVYDFIVKAFYLSVGPPNLQNGSRIFTWSTNIEFIIIYQRATPAQFLCAERRTTALCLAPFVRLLLLNITYLGTITK